MYISNFFFYRFTLMKSLKIWIFGYDVPMIEGMKIILIKFVNSVIELNAQCLELKYNILFLATLFMIPPV